MGAFLRRDVGIITSYRVPFAGELVGAIAVVAEFALISRLVPQEEVPGGYFSFVTVGLIVTAFLAAGVTVLAASIRQEQVQGTLEVMLCAGLSPRRLASGLSAYPLVAASARGLVYGVLAALAGAGFSDANWPLAVVSLALGSVSFIGLGLFAVALVLLFKQAQAVSTWIVSMLTFFAGALFPLSLLPEWVQRLAMLSPVTQALDLARRAILSGESLGEVRGAVLALAVTSVLLVVCGVAALSGGLRRARRTGALGQY
jgi:ABC-2 type transport system permease protein